MFTATTPGSALTAGFFEMAARRNPKPQTVAIVAADADFTRNPVGGAHANAERLGLRVVSQQKYPLSTTDFVPLLR